jgi:hypothetical protein
MTSSIATVLDADGELRWRAWQARGAESDRRTARKMWTVMLLIAAVLVMWLTVLLSTSFLRVS